MKIASVIFLVAATVGCTPTGPVVPLPVERPAIAEIAPGPLRSLLEDAQKQTSITTGYTQDYFVMPYPNGDVPAETGACTDVIIRAFRAAGVDLQKEVHEDMAGNFAAYPKQWGLAKTDTNIDLVSNLRDERSGRYLIIHNIGGGTRAENRLFEWKISGHYRYF